MAANTSLPSLVFAESCFLLLLCSVLTALVTLFFSLCTSYLLNRTMKNTGAIKDIKKTNTWKVIRAQKDETVTSREKECSDCSSARPLFISMSFMLCSLAILFLSFWFGVAMSRYHFLWFVYPYVADVCSADSLTASNVDMFVVSPVQYVMDAVLSQNFSSRALTTYFVQIAELALYAFIVAFLLRSVMGFVSYSNKVYRSLQQAQSELNEITGRIDAVLKQM